MAKYLIASVTKDDITIQTFRCGGSGGQNVNKRDTGVRLIHRDSGATAEAREERSQGQNRKIAFGRLVQHPKFLDWVADKMVAHRKRYGV